MLELADNDLKVAIFKKKSALTNTRERNKKICRKPQLRNRQHNEEEIDILELKTTITMF
jgi:hypothetical protein